MKRQISHRLEKPETSASDLRLGLIELEAARAAFLNKVEAKKHMLTFKEKGELAAEADYLSRGDKLPVTYQELEARFSGLAEKQRRENVPNLVRYVCRDASKEALAAALESCGISRALQ